MATGAFVLGDAGPIPFQITEDGEAVSLSGASAVVHGRCGSSTFTASATIDGSTIELEPPSELTEGVWLLQIVVTFALEGEVTYPNDAPGFLLRVLKRVTD